MTSKKFLLVYNNIKILYQFTRTSYFLLEKNKFSQNSISDSLVKIKPRFSFKLVLKYRSDILFSQKLT